ncbi:MAG: hypothetical protein ACFHU9_00475 [Fluviicola sp.]
MKIKWMLFSLMFLLSGAMAFAQPADGWQEKISWSFKVVKVDENHADVVATAKLIKHWHVYSMKHDPAKADFTGMPTKFTFKQNDNYRLIGKAKDAKKPTLHKDVLGEHLYFEDVAVFNQRIEILSDKPFDIEFEYEFQVCDENGCLFPPAQSAKVKVKGFKPLSKEEQAAGLEINGDMAKDKDGNVFVQHNDKWVRVPEGNSVPFYKEYLKLGGSYE